MIEIHEWECEICGRRFKDEIECYLHEWEHCWSEIKNDIAVYDIKGTPIKLMPFNTGKVYYIKWSSSIAITRFIELYEEDHGHWWASLFPEGIENKECGQVYFDVKDHHWHSITEKVEELKRLLAVFEKSS